VRRGWSILVAWAVITTVRGRWRWLILLHPAITVFVVVGTVNHFWADAIVAAVIDAAVISAQSLLARRLRLARVPRQAAEPVAPASSSSRSLSAVDKLWTGLLTRRPTSGDNSAPGQLVLMA
jgi:hypothetical protein